MPNSPGVSVLGATAQLLWLWSLTLPPQPRPGSRHGLHTTGATNLYIAKYQIDGNRNPIEPSHASSAMFVLTNKSHSSSIEPLLLHHTGTGSWFCSQDRQHHIRTDAGWWFNVTAAAWTTAAHNSQQQARIDSNNTNTNSLPQSPSTFYCCKWLTKNCKDKDW